MPAAITMTSSIASSIASRWNRSSLSHAVANQVNSIHAHQTGTNNSAKCHRPCIVGSWCNPSASAATAATKHRSKNSSNQVDRRSSTSNSRMGAGRIHPGSFMRPSVAR